MPTLQEAFQHLKSNPSDAFIYSDGNIINWADIVSPINHTIHIYPGSFNPLHDGHRAIWESIQKEFPKKSFASTNGYYHEISTVRVGKPNLSLEDIESRLKQFDGYAPVIITGVSRFIQKIGVLRLGNNNRGSLCFHIGSDTAHRLIDDLGDLGLGGLKADFVVYDRRWSGPTNLPMKIYDVAPNFSRAPQIPDVLMGISSTEIRAIYLGEG